MKQFIRVVSSGVYRRLCKPILFRRRPDKVHENMIRMGRFVQSLRIVEPLLHFAWSHNDDGILGQTVLGLYFKNPIGLSAGLDKNAEITAVTRAIGFGFATVGSITAKAASGNPRPWFYRLPKSGSLVVNAGLPNEGAKTIGYRISKYRSRMFDDFPLVASVAKTNCPETRDDEAGVQDYVEGLKTLQYNPHIAMFELNISCPNAFGGEPFTRPQALEKLLEEVDKINLTQPLTIKMPIDKPWPEFEKLLTIIMRHNVQAVTIGNLQKNRKAVQLKDDLPDSIAGNLSGKPCYDASNELIYKTYKTYKDKLIIIGVGGVFSAADAYEKICAGASLVELITGLIFEGPQLVGQINHDLAGFLKKDGYSNISEAIGTSHSS